MSGQTRPAARDRVQDAHRRQAQDPLLPHGANAHLCRCERRDLHQVHNTLHSHSVFFQVGT